MLGLAGWAVKHVKLPKWVDDPKVWRHVHATLTFLWLLAVIPSLIWWKDSVPWIVFMSVWANVASSIGSWQAARAEDSNSEE